jgi:hypothetical protein
VTSLAEEFRRQRRAVRLLRATLLGAALVGSLVAWWVFR